MPAVVVVAGRIYLSYMSGKQKDMCAILNVLVILLVFIQYVCCSDITISANDYCMDTNITITATYTGTASVTYVEWYYNGDVSGTLIITASTCTKFANPTGYPGSTTYLCDPSSKTFKLTLKKDEIGLPKIFGATFGITPGSTAGNIQSTYAYCPEKTYKICLLSISLTFIIIGLFVAGFLAACVISVILRKGKLSPHSKLPCVDVATDTEEDKNITKHILMKDQIR